jgi:hypothetical protein
MESPSISFLVGFLGTEKSSLYTVKSIRIPIVCEAAPKKQRLLLGLCLEQSDFRSVAIGGTADFVVVLNGLWLESSVGEIKAVASDTYAAVEAVFVDDARSMRKAGLCQLDPLIVRCFDPLAAEPRPVLRKKNRIFNLVP